MSQEKQVKGEIRKRRGKEMDKGNNRAGESDRDKISITILESGGAKKGSKTMKTRAEEV